MIGLLLMNSVVLLVVLLYDILKWFYFYGDILLMLVKYGSFLCDCFVINLVNIMFCCIIYNCMVMFLFVNWIMGFMWFFGNVYIRIVMVLLVFIWFLFGILM